jgi:dTDP-4-dehydrorhamnose 3,5-epimerase
VYNEWRLPHATKDPQGITADWEFTNQPQIDGVVVREMKHVATGYGFLTEVFRNDWQLDGLPVDQVFQSTLLPGRISAWHAHETTTDRLFVLTGMLRIVLYDTRVGSPSYGTLSEYRFGAVRPALVVIPPKIWHGIQNIADTPTTVLNLVDQAYHYEDPDHWRVPPDSPAIPYRFLG